MHNIINSLLVLILFLLLFSEWSASANMKRDEIIKLRKRKRNLAILGKILVAIGSTVLAMGLRQNAKDMAYENTVHANSRLVAEKLMSEIWKSIAGVKPYASHDTKAYHKFNTKIDEIISADVRGFREISEEDIDIALNNTRHRHLFEFPLDIKNSNGTNYNSHRELYWHERVIAYTEQRLEKAKGKQKKAKRDTFLERFLFTPMAFFSFMNQNSGLSNTAVVLAGYNSAFGTERGSEDLFELVNKLKLLKRKRERDQDPLRDEGWDKFVHQFETTMLSQTENFAKKLKKNAGKADAAFHEIEMKVYKDNGIVDKVPVPMQEPQKRSFFQRAATSINSAMGIGMNLGLPQILHFVGMIMFSRKNDEEN